MDRNLEIRENEAAELEALLFASARPLSTKLIAKSLGMNEQKALALIEAFRSVLEKPSRGLQLREMNDSWRLETKSIHADVVAAIRSERGERPLTQQALETLAVVALRQPVSADEVTAIRGVDSAATIQTLRGRRFISKVARQPGQPGRWRTTQTFLDLFGLRNLDDLYRDNKLERIFGPVYGVADSRNNSAQNGS